MDSTYHKFLKQGIVLESPEESQAFVEQYWSQPHQAYWGPPPSHVFGGPPTAEQAASSSAPASSSSSALWE